MPLLKMMISHASEDRLIAEAWKVLLGRLYGNATGIWYSNDPAGAFDGLKPFAVKIVEKIRKASIILTIQTRYSVQKPWVIWEAGVANGSKKPTFIVTYDLKRGSLGNPLDGMDQHEGLDRRSVSALCTTIGRTAKQSPFDEKTFSDAWNTYVSMVTVDNIGLPIITPTQYDKGIVLRVPISVSIGDDTQKILEETYVLDDNGGLSLFGWDENKPSVKWAAFYADLAAQDKVRKWPGSALGWADVLDDVIHLVLKDKLGNR